MLEIDKLLTQTTDGKDSLTETPTNTVNNQDTNLSQDIQGIGDPVTDANTSNIQQGRSDVNAQQGVPQDPTQDNQQGLSDEQKLMAQLTAQNIDPLNAQINRNAPQADPRVWSIDDTQRGYVEQIGKGMAQGLGEFVIAGTGDMLQVLGSAIPGISISKGNVFSRFLQKSGHEFAKTYGEQYIPDALKDENIKQDFSTYVNPQFWTIKMSQYIPQLAEFLLIGHGASSLAKGATEGLLKTIAGDAVKAGVETASSVARGVGLGLKEAVGQELGLAASGLKFGGGLMPGLEGVVGNLGAGLSNNLFEGMQNAAQVVNQNKDLLNPDGSKMFTEEQLGEMASGIVLQNLRWVGIDALSWGVTYGKALKAFKTPKLLEEFAKTGRLFTKAEQLTTSGKFFAKAIKTPLNVLSRTAKFLGKGVFEGQEESIQEVWQNWTQEKVLSEVTGKPFKYAGTSGFWDYYNSPQSESTKAISFGVGFMGGTGSTIVEHINNIANKEYDVFRNSESLKKNLKSGVNTGEDLRNMTDNLMDNHFAGQPQRNDVYIKHLKDTKVISEDAAKQLLERNKIIGEAVKEGAAMNYAGRFAFAQAKMDILNEQEYLYKIQQTKEAKIKSLEPLKESDPKAYKKAIKEVDEEFSIPENKSQMTIAMKKDLIVSLLQGKEIEDPGFIAEVQKDGKTIRAKISPENYDKYYKMSDEQIFELAKQAESKLDQAFKQAHSLKSKLGKAGKLFLNKFKKSKEAALDKANQVKNKVASKFYKDKEHITVDNFESVISDKTNAPDFISTIDGIVPRNDGESAQGFLERVKKMSTEDKQPIVDALNKQIDDINIKRREKAQLDSQETVKEKPNPQTEGPNAEAKDQFNEAFQKTYEVKDGETSDEAARRIIKEAIKEKAFKNVNDAKEYLQKKAKELAKKGEDGLLQIMNALNNVVDDNFLLEEFLVKAGITLSQRLDNLNNFTKEKIEQIKKTFKPETTEDQKRVALGMEKRKSSLNKEAQEAVKRFEKEHREKLKRNAKAENPELSNAEINQLVEQRLFNIELVKLNIHNDRVNKAIADYRRGEPISSDDLNSYSERMFRNAAPRVGLSVTEQAIAINDHLKKMYPGQFISVVPLNNMYSSIKTPDGGLKGLGFSMGSTIYIDEKAWQQNDIYMHEFAHILYSTNPDSDLIKSYLEKALLNKDLIESVKDKYQDLILYSNGKVKTPVTIDQLKRRTKRFQNLSNSQIRKALEKSGWKEIPQSQQRFLNDEIFVHTLQGPLSKTYSKFFTKSKEPLRQFRTKTFWKNLKNRAKKADAEQLATTLLEKETTDLRYEIINGFVKSIQGKTIDVRGMASMVDSAPLELEGDSKQKINESLDKNTTKESVNRPIEVDTSNTINVGEDITQFEGTDQEIIFAKTYDIILKKAERVLSSFISNTKQLEKEIFKLDENNNNKKFEHSFNEKNFRSDLSYLATITDYPVDFINHIQDSNNPIEKSFFNHLRSLMGYDDTVTLLNSIWYVVHSSTVMEGQMNVVTDGVFSTMTSLASNEQRQLDRILSRINKSLNPFSPKREELKSLIATKRYGKYTKENAYKILLHYSNKSAETKRALDKGYITIDGAKMLLPQAILKLQEKGLFMPNSNGTGLNLTIGAEDLIKDIISSTRPFTYLSTQTNAKGDQFNSRRMKSNLSISINQMQIDLTPDENGKVMSEKKFLDKYSHINHLLQNDKRNKSTKELVGHLSHNGNNLLKSMYASAKRGVLPQITVFAGTQYSVNEYSSNNVYKESTPEQNTLEDVMRFLHAKRNNQNTYDATPHIFSDASQKYLMNMPILTQEQLSNSSSLIQTLYAIDAHANSLNTDNEGNRIAPPTFAQFEKGYKNELNKFIKRIETQSESLKLIDLFEDFYNKEGKLTTKAKKQLKEFYLSDFANKSFIHEIFAPGISAKDLPKRLKGIQAPTMPLDKNTHLELIPVENQYFKDQYDKNGKTVLANDSGQYIDEESALMLQSMGHGVFDLNHGFKLINYSQEMSNPYFKGRTVYMKGYTTVLTEEMVKKEPYLKPYLDSLKKRREIYKESMLKKYGKDWEAPKRFNIGAPVHFPIVTPISADKSSLYTNRQITLMNGAPETTGLNKQGKEKFPLVSRENMETEDYHNFLTRMNYVNGEFVGLDAGSLGIQQQMDKISKTSKVPIQTASYLIAQLFSQSKSETFKGRILDIQEALGLQAEADLTKHVTSKITKPNGELVSGKEVVQYILKGLNKEKALPSLIDFIKNGGSINNPYSQSALINQIKNNIKKYGIQIRVPGTWAQQVSDAGYRLYGDSMGIFEDNADYALKSGNSNLNMKGYEPIYDKEGNVVGNKPAHIVLPVHMSQGDNAIRPRKAFVITDQSLVKETKKEGVNDTRSFEDVASVLLNQAIKYAKQLGPAFKEQMKISTDKELEALIRESRVLTSDDEIVGYFVPGEYVIATRVPVGHVGFTGVFEAIDFRGDKGNQVIVSSQFKDLVGSDDDGDALIINTEAKGKSRVGKSNWNKAFKLMIEHWTSPEMDEFLKTSLDFTEQTREDVNQMKNILKVKDNKDYIPLNSFSNSEEMIKNGLVAKSVLGKVINLHRSLNIIASYGGQLKYHFNSKGKIVTKNVKITLNTHDYNSNGEAGLIKKFFSTFQDFGEGEKNRVIKSSNFTQLILDAMKETFVSDLNLDTNSVEVGLIMTNHGFSLTSVGLLLNHPIAKEYFNRLKDIDNPYIVSKSRKQIYRDMLLEHKLEAVREDVNRYDRSAPALAKQFEVNLLPDVPIAGLPYNSDKNNFAVLDLIQYYQDVIGEAKILNRNLSGHNERGMESNPVILEKNIKDIEDFMSNKKQGQLIKFTEVEGPDKSNTYISQNFEIKKYLDANKFLLNILNEYALSTHETLKDVSKYYLDNILDNNLTNNYRMNELTKSLKKIVVSRILGINNISKAEMNSLVSPDSENNIFKQLDAYEDSILRDSPDSENNYFFNNVIDYSYNRNTGEGTLAINHNLNSVTAGEGSFETINDENNLNDFQRAKEAFSELPVELQKNLIIADLILNGFEGKTLYPAFPFEVQKAINNSSDDVQSISYITKEVKDEYKEALLQKEINNERNGLRKVYISEKKADFSLVDVRTKIFGQSLEDLYNGKDLLISVISQNYQGQLNKNKQGESNKIFKIKGLTDQQRKTLNESLKKSTGRMYTRRNDILNIVFRKDDMTNSYSNVSVVEKVKRLPHDIDLLSIGEDVNTTGPKLDELLKQKEVVKKKDNTVVPIQRGMALQEDLRFFESSEKLSPEDYFRATKYNRVLTEDQKQVIHAKYVSDFNEAQKLIEEGFLKRIQDKNISDQDLTSIYNSFQNKDIYGFSSILMPLTRVRVNRDMANHAQMIYNKTGGRVSVTEGDNDMSYWKAMMQANNATSEHPATQAAQRAMEIEFKKFTDQRKRYVKKLNGLTDTLYVDKFGRIGTKNKILNKIRMAILTLIKGKKSIYETLYGGITETIITTHDGVQQKQLKLLTTTELNKRFEQGLISQAELNFANHFKETVKELHEYSHKGDTLTDSEWVPKIAMDRYEAFSNKGLLGLLASTKNKSIGDVKLFISGEFKTFKEIEDTYRSVGGKNFTLIKDYANYKIKAIRYLKKGMNEDGTRIEYSNVQNNTIMGDGLMNRFSNSTGFVNANDMVSMDLNKALYDYTHTTLFVNGNEHFKGFKQLQYQIDALMVHNATKGFDNTNKMIRRVIKEGILNAPKLEPDTPVDDIVKRLTRANLFYILGWKMLFLGKGLYAIGNLAVGKYNTVKNIGGEAFLKGEARFWGFDKTGKIGLRRSQGILKTLNLLDINVYDEVNFEKKQGLAGVFGDLALAPMIMTEKWAQGVHFLGLLTEEQMQLFDKNGHYKEGVDKISNEEIVSLEDKVKGVHGRGYSPTDQRLIQTYSWGKMIMQFSRFIPTTIHDRFAKEDINKYGQEHIGSLTAVWQPIYKMVTGKMSFKEFKNYRNTLTPEKRNRLDSGLRGLSFATIAAFLGAHTNDNTLHQLNRDMNIYADAGKMGWRATPPTVRTIYDMIKSLF